MKIGFIGCGNMAGAMVGGMIGSGKVDKTDIIVSARSQETLQKRSKALGVATTLDNRKVAEESDVLFFAVKPQFYAEVIREVAFSVKEDAIVVSIAPGITLASLEKLFERPLKIVRTMPNTPAQVGEGMTGVCKNERVSDEEMTMICELLSTFGKAEEVPERLMDVVVSVSGSSPAYVFMFIEAMADAAVADGMPRAQAYKFAAQSVLGSAKMVLETGKHPGELKDMVCSPGGTTIEAVRVLEAKGLRSAVIEAMKSCTAKSIEFGEK